MATHRSDTPLYRRLARQLQERIAAGTYPAGSRLPSEPELSADFGVNRLTVRQAVAELERAAVLEIRRGVGTFVRPPAVRVSITVDPRSQRFDLGSVHRALPLDTPCRRGRRASSRATARPWWRRRPSAAPPRTTRPPGNSAAPSGSCPGWTR